MNEMLTNIWSDKLLMEDATQLQQSHYRKLQGKIEIQTSNLPKGMRTPTDKELGDMEEYGRWYKQANPKTSARNMRRAICRKFNLSILPDTLDI